MKTNTLYMQIRQCIQKSIRFLYDHTIHAKSMDEDDKRREFILNIILLSTLFLLLWSNIYIWIGTIIKNTNRHGVSALLFGIFSLLFIGLFVLSKRGYCQQSSYAVIGLYYAGATYAAIHWGPNLPSALLGYAVVILISSILIDTRFGFIMGIISASTITILGYIEDSKIILPDVHWKKDVFLMGDAVEYSILLLVIMILSWLSNREIDKSLKRARTSEQALKLERDNLEIKVEERTKELKQVQLDKMTQLYRFAEFGKLSSGIFHDLINPLQALSLSIHKLQHMGQIPEVNPYIQKAVSASNKMESFIMAIRKQLQQQDNISYFSLNNEIEEVCSLIEYKARKMHVEIQFEATEEVWKYGNALKFHQIISNIVSNAIDSYEEKFAKKPIEIVHISLLKKEYSACITIQDQGSGISEDILQKMFDPFFTTKSAYKGTGLGLSTSKDIIEKDFAGSIAVQSNIGAGTTFILSFKLHNQPHENSNTIQIPT